MSDEPKKKGYLIYQNSQPMCSLCLVVLLRGGWRKKHYTCPKCGNKYRK